MSWQGVVISKPCLHLCSMACLLVNLCFIFKHFSFCFPTPYRLSCLIYKRVRVTSIISTINVTANEPLVFMVRWLLESKNIDKFKLACCDWLANRRTIPVAEFSESCPPYDHLVFTATIPCYFAFSWTNQYRTSLLFVTYRPLFPHSMWLVNERSDKYGHCQVLKSSTSIKTGKSVVFGYASFGFNMLCVIWLVFNF